MAKRKQSHIKKSKKKKKRVIFKLLLIREIRVQDLYIIEKYYNNIALIPDELPRAEMCNELPVREIK